jgi:hypothetical protein
VYDPGFDLQHGGGEKGRVEGPHIYMESKILLLIIMMTNLCAIGTECKRGRIH